jgi:hypothetical protein
MGTKLQNIPTVSAATKKLNDLTGNAKLLRESIDFFYRNKGSDSLTLAAENLLAGVSPTAKNPQVLEMESKLAITERAIEIQTQSLHNLTKEEASKLWAAEYQADAKKNATRTAKAAEALLDAISAEEATYSQARTSGALLPDYAQTWAVWGRFFPGGYSADNKNNPLRQAIDNLRRVWKIDGK